ncbi:hypothetical protein V5279_05010 [Bradyrhizobium sp. 26S5]|uniref:hypothetical protein n=1 Tax=Bradyrhizobium sp. 26S5 TaxID=3139729 RepID=UPI0030D47BD7
MHISIRWPTESSRAFIEIAVAFGAALCLLGDFRFSDTAGFTLAAVVLLWQWRQRPRNAVAAA